MTTSLPPSAALAWHATSWLRGHESADALSPALGLDLDQLAALRRSGADGLGLALRRPGTVTPDHLAAGSITATSRRG